MLSGVSCVMIGVNQLWKENKLERFTHILDNWNEKGLFFDPESRAYLLGVDSAQLGMGLHDDASAAFQQGYYDGLEGTTLGDLKEI